MKLSDRARTSCGLVSLLLLAGCGGGASEPVHYYHFICNGDPECLSTNFAGAPSGTSSQGPGQAGISGCNGLLYFGNNFWNIPPAQQWCDTSPGMNPPPVPAVTVSLAPSTIDAGQSATLTWSSTLMTSCTASGAWSGARGTSGTLVVAPPTPGTYRYGLSCTGSSGPASGLATLTVAVPPPTVQLALSPAAITVGQSATLTWTTWQYTSCTASGPWSGPVALNGSQVVTPVAAGTYTYVLSCLSATKGTGTGAATLTVAPAAGPPPAPPTVSLTAATEYPSCIDTGQATTLTWSSTGATSCTAGGAWSGPLATSGSELVFPGAALATALSTFDYALTCEGSGGTASAVVKVCASPGNGTTPPPRPTVSIAVSPASISLGESATLTWSSQYAGSCTASDAWTGLRPLAGTASVTPPSAGIFVYQLSCQGYQGLGSGQAILSVQVASGSSPLAARFCRPQGLAFDASDTLWIADSGNSTIRTITRGGLVSTVAGLAGYGAYADGLGASARFNSPVGIVVDAAGRVLVGDAGNDAVRQVASDGTVTTLAGRPGNLANGVPVDGTGAGASFWSPYGVAVAASGDAFVADYGVCTIRKVTPGGVATTFAGAWGVTGSADGTGTAATFRCPTGLAIPASGDLYVTDMANHTIRKVTPDGVVTTFAGTAGVPGSADGQGAAARFSSPFALAADSQGNLLVVDQGNLKIRKITPAGVVSTFAGSGAWGGANGAAGEASFYNPAGIAVDSADEVYVADGASIRRITPAGVVSLFAGQADACGATN